MRIFVKTRPGSRLEKVEKVDETHFLVWVKAPAKEGKANQAVIALLARYFDIPKSFVIIESGFFAKEKVILVALPDKL